MKTFDLTFWNLSVILSLSALPLATLGQVDYATPYTFVTMAGRSPYGSADGTGGAARFTYPSAVTYDGADNLYVAEFSNHTIRKVTLAGEVTTLAGLAGYEGSLDGTAGTARFSHPVGMAFDSVGNAYVADAFNHTIRKMNPAGVVTTLAGTAGAPGVADGTGPAVRFNQPWDLEADGAGNLYVADAGNHVIRKVTSAGEVTTLAGTPGLPGSNDGPLTSALFYSPAGVTLDSAGNLYVADTGNHTIRKVTLTGVVTTLAGLAGVPGSADGNGSSARFNQPNGMEADSAGNLYVADTYNHTIRKVTPGGAVTTLAGRAGYAGFADGTGSTARFYFPGDVTVDDEGNVYVVDVNNCAIRKLTTAREVTTLAGYNQPPGHDDGNGCTARFNFPWGLAMDSVGNAYIADQYNHTIRKMTPSGEVSTLAGSAGNPGPIDGIGPNARFRFPVGVAVDGAGNIYVADYANHTIRKVTPSAEVTTLAGLAGNPGSQDGWGSNARFRNPAGVGVDNAGNVFVADTFNHTIRKITPDRTVTTMAGSPGHPGSDDGTGPDALFNQPYSLAVDSAANVYVADTANRTIRKITPAGVVTTLAGLAGSPPDHRDATGSAARFVFPISIAVDSAGSIYVGDAVAIRKVTPIGMVTTLAGKLLKDPLDNTLGGTANGTGSSAGFNYFILAVDSAGNLWGSEVGSHTIRKGIPASSVPAPVLEPPSFSASQVSFDMTGLPGLNVDLESSSDFSQWQPVGIRVLEGGTNRFFTPVSPSALRFFRTHVR